MPLGDVVLQVSASIGVTLYPQDGADADQLLRHADQAMYIAKQSGKNRYHLFDVDQDVAVQTQRESMERIRLALDKHEFVLHYQPKVNMRTGSVIGAEALIRWQHPERGLLPPIVFLPLIENSAFSVALGEWVINTALSQLDKWRAAGFSLPVSVNISAHQLQQIEFVGRLSTLLAAHPDIHPSLLQLEILETSALEDISRVSSIMNTCRQIGVRFALDDFGTGYSSLIYLKRLPADVLKIDQSFIRDMLDDPSDLAIVEGVIGLAAAFRRECIAEGVETITHGLHLLTLGCDLAQGYGIARPMPADDFPAWAASWAPYPAWTAWRGLANSRDEITLVHAEVEHRHWINNIDAYLGGKRDTPPPMSHQECNLGMWLQTDGGTRYREHPFFSTVLSKHEQIHTLGRDILALHLNGEQDHAQNRMPELYALHDELITMLGVLAGRAD